MQPGLLAEPAADIADQNANVVLRLLEDLFGENVAGRGGSLRLRMQRQPAGLLVDFGDAAARLHGRRDQPLAGEIERHHMRGIRERVVDLGGVAIAHRRDDVVGRVRPHHGRAGLHGRGGIHHRRPHVEVDLDRLGRKLRHGPRGGHHRNEAFAGIADHLMRQQPARRHRHRRAVRALEDRQGRQRADIRGDQIGAGVDRDHAVDRLRRRHVDRLDHRVRVRRAQHVQPQRAVVRLVVDELAHPRQQATVFEALDGQTRAEAHIAGQNIHRMSLMAIKLSWMIFASLSVV